MAIAAPEPVLLAWSGGKDSVLALWELLKTGDYSITLLATFTEGYRRLSLHGVREELIEAQAASLGLPLVKVWIPLGCTNEEYDRRMEETLCGQRLSGVRRVAFGDIFLADVRAYRERNLARAGMEGLFPLWGRNTKQLAEAFLEAGFKAIAVCIDSEALDRGFAGRIYDRGFLADLPPGIDPCGENGEFHTFVFDGPNFRVPVGFRKGETVLREGRFYYCDLLEHPTFGMA
ncbi:MAG: diphthine--ammonia ligase [Bacillota bacterium]